MSNFVDSLGWNVQLIAVDQLLKLVRMGVGTADTKSVVFCQPHNPLDRPAVLLEHFGALTEHVLEDQGCLLGFELRSPPVLPPHPVAEGVQGLDIARGGLTSD